MTREEIVNEYFTEHRYDILLNPYAGLLDFAKYLDEHSELPEGLEEAEVYLASEIAPNYPDISWDDCYERIKEGVIAGAEWQKAKMMDEWLKDRNGCFWDGVEEGKKAMEEQIMEKAVDGRYMKAVGKVYVESWPLDIDPNSVKAGDEVRLIVIPK